MAAEPAQDHEAGTCRVWPIEGALLGQKRAQWLENLPDGTDSDGTDSKSSGKTDFKENSNYPVGIKWMHSFSLMKINEL